MCNAGAYLRIISTFSPSLITSLLRMQIMFIHVDGSEARLDKDHIFIYQRDIVGSVGFASLVLLRPASIFKFELSLIS